MMKLKLAFGALIISLFIFLQSKAATYYVDSKNGNDVYTGLSKDKAWKTLSKVNTLILKPGDSVLFRAATTYTGQLKISCAGNKDNKIVFSSFGIGKRPRIDGKGTVRETVLIFNAEYLKFENFEITNLGEKREAKRMGLHILLEDYGIANDTEIANLYIHDVNGSNVKKEGGGAGIHWTNGGKKKRSAFDGLLIENCRIERTDRNGITSTGYWSRQDWFPSRNVIIRKNHLTDIGGDGIVPIGCEGTLIESNVVYRAGQRFPEGDAAAGIWPWSCDNTTIQYNEVSYTAGPWDSQGFDSDWNCRNTIIQYNYSHHNDGGFLLICNDGSSTMPANIGNIGTIIRYNVSYNDGSRTKWKHAGFSPVIHITGPVLNTKIYNNLIYLPKKPAGIDSTVIEMDTWNGYPDSTLVANNIFYTKGTADFQMAKSKRNYYRSNLYYGNYLNKPETPGEILADPQFLSQPDKDLSGFEKLKCFMLRATSKARGAGESLTESKIRDFFGNPVSPGQRPAVGIHEN
ncbi:right-handed parallel beta-helix repeat-containing protein [Pedobacter sp. B4-66]|uniref:right-handed parallel beta-helix repeat-containing protein n=1 Tax=Pedobacter sp. B4-66 TaxID=2817280 RepID=UPI001BD97D64|nr:right-handed parallel beta-helix repeat-containing protein [Pedobacter sp. B4-66]